MPKCRSCNAIDTFQSVRANHVFGGNK